MSACTRGKKFSYCRACDERCDRPNDWNIAQPLWYGQMVAVADMVCSRDVNVDAARRFIRYGGVA